MNILRSWRCAATIVLVFALLPWTVSLVGAQSAARTHRIGLLSGGTDPSGPLAPQWLAFFDAMRALGWVDGQNILVERRFAGGKPEQVPSFANELAQLGVEVIVATGLPENQAVRRATTTIPVVMVVVDDPVATQRSGSLSLPCRDRGQPSTTYRISRRDEACSPSAWGGAVATDPDTGAH